MKKSRTELVNEGASAAGSAVVAAGLGALLGPELAAIGGIAGAVGGLAIAQIAPHALRDTFITRYFANRKVYELLADKLAADYRYSFLHSSSHFQEALGRVDDVSAAAHAVDMSIRPLAKLFPHRFRWNVGDGPIPVERFKTALSELRDYCRANGPIRIATTAICAAPISLFQWIQTESAKFDGVEFSVSSSSANGVELFTKLSDLSHDDYDFVIGPFEALQVIDRRARIPIKALGPVFGELQSIYIAERKGWTIHSGAWVYMNSTAEFQYIVGKGVSRNAEIKPVETIPQIVDVVANVPAGDMIPCWEPLSHILDHNPKYKKAPDGDYLIHFFLFGHKRVLPPHLFPLQAFLDVFRYAWSHWHPTPKALAIHLPSDEAYMHNFARSCGLHWHSKSTRKHNNGEQ